MALRHLSLRDFVIVDTLQLEFESGFTALTGETGAGKYLSTHCSWCWAPVQTPAWSARAPRVPN